jgi:hypothetical protein
VFPPGGALGGAKYNGGVAQLGERVNGIHEVRGSIPLASIPAVAPATVKPAPAACCETSGSASRGGVPPAGHVDSPERAGIAQLVEHNLAKVGVAGSSPVSRSRKRS